SGGGLDMQNDQFFLYALGGIRTRLVTGVQTCALPIAGMGTTMLSGLTSSFAGTPTVMSGTLALAGGSSSSSSPFTIGGGALLDRSEERRVGKEGRGWKGRGVAGVKGGKLTVGVSVIAV